MSFGGLLGRLGSVVKRFSHIFEASESILLIFLRFRSVLEAVGGILEAPGKRFGGILGRLHDVFSSLQEDTTVSVHFK